MVSSIRSGGYHRTRRLRLASLSTASVFLVSGCAASTPTAPATSARSSPVTGPWAAQITTFLGKDISDFERAALADGRITDQEYSAVEQRYRRCMKAAGITITEMRPDGGVEYELPSMDTDKGVAEENKCSRSSGQQTVGSLYEQMRRNPRNLDEAEIGVACLIRAGVVPPGYSKKDWKRDNDDDTGPFAMDSPRRAQVEKCSSDPLGLL